MATIFKFSHLLRKFYVMLKLVNLFAFLSLTVLISSCSNNENSDSDVKMTGKWNLVNISGGLLGDNKSYEKGEITWDLTDNNTIVVVNNTDDSFHEFLDTGIHNYNIKYLNNSECLGQININTMSMGCLKMNENTLTISYLALDGYLFEFEK